MRKRTLALAALLAIGAGATAYTVSERQTERPDCPGKIVCPLTGEPVCKDQCPIGAQAVVKETPAPLPSCCQVRN